MKTYSKDRIDESMYPIYELLHNYKLLIDFYKKYKRKPYSKSEEEIRNRIKYILDNKVRQRGEIETLYWVLGEKYEESNI